jgi:hypothetical protein
VKLSRLLDLAQRTTAPQGLAHILGDGRLCARNPWYRSVRVRVLDLGYRFEDGEGPVNALYRCAPLLALEAILTHRALPVVDNVRPLSWLISQSGDFDVPFDFIVSEVARNHVLHESAHCVAHERLCAGVAPRELASRSPREALVRSLLGEAFANSIESFAVAWSTEPVDALLLALNSYCSYNRSDLSSIQLAVSSLGMAGAFEMSVCAFFAAQLHYDATIPPPAVLAELQAVARRRGLLGNPQAVEKLAASAFMLSSGFRAQTAPNYLRFLGIDDPCGLMATVSLADTLTDAEEASLLGELVAVTTADVAQAGEQELRHAG